MKITTYTHNGNTDLGLLIEDKIYSLNAIADNMNDFLSLGDSAMEKAKEIENSIKEGVADLQGIELADSNLLAPVPHPASCRDAYAFRQHVATARRNRGVDMIPEFDQFPIFYFTNHNAILGPSDDIICMPDHMQKLDFELEAAIVIGKKGRKIKIRRKDAILEGKYLEISNLGELTAEVDGKINKFMHEKNYFVHESSYIDENGNIKKDFEHFKKYGFRFEENVWISGAIINRFCVLLKTSMIYRIL